MRPTEELSAASHDRIYAHISHISSQVRQMEELSAAVDAVIRRSEEERSAALDAAAVSGGEIKADDLDAITEQLERYSTVEHVLKAHPFRGINRKAQLKPCAWAEGDGEDGAPTECLFILKWGGELTALGEAQAESLGTRFRSVLYPGDEVGGLLRLHSTYRHDLKIYSSDEGRVQMTAAPFTKGFLDVEGMLTPILASLVSKNKARRRRCSTTSHTGRLGMDASRSSSTVLTTDNKLSDDENTCDEREAGWALAAADHVAVPSPAAPRRRRLATAAVTADLGRSSSRRSGCRAKA